MTEKVVLITDYTWPSIDLERKVLTSVGARVVCAETGSEEELVRLGGNADAILTCFAKVTDRVIQAAKGVEVIARYGIGVDNIAVEEATRRGVLVTNVPAYCLDEVAEHALALLLSLARKTCSFSNAIRKGNWEIDTGFPIRRVSGQTLGIVGFGKIGRTLSAKARGLGLHIIAHDPQVPDDVVREHGAEPVSLIDLATRADFVSVHAPLTESTTHLLNEGFLKRMKRSAYLINTARGRLIDQEGLVRALREGWIAGAGIDVFDPERLPPNHPLLAAPNLVATPHVAFYSEQSVRELQTQAAESVAAVFTGRRPRSVVNGEVLLLQRWSHLT